MDKILVDKSVLEQALMALTWMSDCYVGDDDDSGECASCHERSYMPHAPTCKKQNAINTLQSVLAQQVADPTDPGHDVEVLREQVRHLERRVRDVTSIMLDVVPGADGEGVEIFAKTSADVVRKLTEMGQRIEELESCHSPRREWQGLTNPDIARVFRAVYGGARFGPSEKEFAIAVEDALKVKNNR